MTRHDDLTEQILIRWKTEHAALGLAIARLEVDAARLARITELEKGRKNLGNAHLQSKFDSADDLGGDLARLRAVAPPTRASAPASKPLHWTQRPENRAKVRRQLRKATAARGKR